MATRDEMFKTTRMALLRGVNPAYIAGQYVHLQRDVQGFLKGSRAKVVTVQVARPGEHRYLLFIEGEKIWAFEAQLAEVERLKERRRQQPQQPGKP